MKKKVVRRAVAGDAILQIWGQSKKGMMIRHHALKLASIFRALSCVLRASNHPLRLPRPSLYSIHEQEIHEIDYG